MSYSRRFKKNVTVHYSGSVSYPPSQNGGSTSYSGSVTEEVIFDVTVDTDPFDNEVGVMKEHVDLLTGSIVATKTAHVATIDETSKKIGDTIVAGFFKTVKSDISQQIAQLKAQSESLLIQMNKLAQRCRDKQRQMGVDYQRISDRYLKIFTDLNRELENRIYSIDEPIFHSTRVMDETGQRGASDDSVSTVSISAGENAHVHSLLAANLAKKRAAEAIDKGRKFLEIQYATDRVIDKCLMPGAESCYLDTPFCVMTASTGPGVNEQYVYASPLLKDVAHESLTSSMDAVDWKSQVTAEEARIINDYFTQNNNEASGAPVSAHDARVAQMTARLFNLSHTVKPGN
ncbi:MAG: hypothetical protein K2M31_09780 [Muribaculaceae bacterium]|nr:hypothetical protein [Muribaculaceae bacterium]